jgi:TIGR03009 family protein
MLRRLFVGLRYGLLASAGLLLAGGLAMAQSGAWNGPPPNRVPAVQYPPPQGMQPGAAPGVQPDQPVSPPLPTLRRNPTIQPPPVPFVLTPQEQAAVDRVLDAWEQAGKGVRTFQCSFTRWEYDATFPGKASRENPNGAKYIDTGTIKYQAPDKGFFEATGNLMGIPKVRHQEKWICDGKSVFVYEYAKQPPQLTEHPLPKELQGKDIVDGPLPFLFGAKAEKLKQRYYLRIITPPGVQGQVWLEAYPRFLADARNFQRALLVLKTTGMIPVALKTYLPGGNDSQVYAFDDVVINDPMGWRGIFGNQNPFEASIPVFGNWKKVVEKPDSPSQASRR